MAQYLKVCIEMAQQLRTLAALVENLGLVPGTQIVANNYL